MFSEKNQEISRWLELLAVLLNLLYTFFYLQANPICFFFGILSPLLFISLTWKKKIYADTFLQGFYVVMAICGFIIWGGEWKKIHWSWAIHLTYIVTGIAITIACGALLKKKTDAQLPFIDSFTTVFAMVGTWMMMNFVHENWLYFIIINCTSVYIYARRKLYLGAAMFFIYLLMSVDGYFELNLFQLW